MLMFVAEVATNLVAPAVTFDAGFACTVEVIVSMPFATKYVLKYKVKTRRNGFETKNACGRAIAGRIARRKHDLKVVFVAAFSMIDLSTLSDMSRSTALLHTCRWCRPGERQGTQLRPPRQHPLLLAGRDCGCSNLRHWLASMGSLQHAD